MGARKALTGNGSAIDEPVTVLSLTLVRADSGGVNHCDGVISIEGDG